jgi:CheY-like chemotaxis protein
MAVNILIVDDGRAMRSMIAKIIRENLALSNILRAIVPAHEGVNNGNRALKKGGSA